MQGTLTPVQQRGDWLFKREDLFQPFEDCKINGTKLRQWLLIMKKNYSQINNGIITCLSVNSPQGAMCAKVAQHYHVPCTILYGGTTLNNLKKYIYPKFAIDHDANIVIAAKTGRMSVLKNRLQNFKDNKFQIIYGDDFKNNIDCYIQGTAIQVQNIPDSVKKIYVTCGSAITVCGILAGITLYNKNIEKIIAVGVAPNRKEKIIEYCKLLNDFFKIDIDLTKLEYIDGYNNFKGYKYQNIMHESYYDINFHSRYEAKTWNYAKHNIPKDYDSLFWITGSEQV